MATAISVPQRAWRAGVAGLLGAAAAHIAVISLNRAWSAEMWLKGPYGPPFFNIALFMGILYACVAWGVSGRARWLLPVFLGPFLGITIPMAFLTRFMSWGEGPMSSPTSAWYYSVITVFVISVWGTIFAVGAAAGEGRPWRSGAAATLGAFAGYVVLTALLWAAPNIARWAWAAGGYLPQPTVLLDGLLTGVGMAVALGLALRR